MPEEKNDFSEQEVQNDADFDVGFKGEGEGKGVDNGAGEGEGAKGEGEPTDNGDDANDVKDDKGEGEVADDDKDNKDDADKGDDDKGGAGNKDDKGDENQGVPKDIPPQPPIVKKETKIFVKEFLDTLSDEKIEVNGAELNIKEYAKEYPEEAAISIAIASKIAEQVVSERIEQIMGEKFKDIESMRDRVFATEFWREVEYDFPNARKTGRDKNFHAWLDKQSSGMKKLAESWEVGDALTVLRSYDATITKPVVRKVSQSRVADLHGENQHGGKHNGNSGLNSKDDFDAGFKMP
jgi:hypothetical protein